MAIIHVRGLALCAIPKVASTAMRQAVLRSLSVIDPDSYNHPALKVDDEINESEWVMAIVRHPLDRLVSVYHYFLIDDTHPTFSLKEAWTGMPFGDFVAMVSENRDEDVHTRLQSSFLPRRINDIDVLENVGPAWKRLQKKFGWLDDLVPTNASEREEGWKDYYDDASLKLAKRAYESDFELYERVREGKWN